MDSSTATLWSRYKALKWYWKVILVVPFLLAGAYVLLGRRGGDEVTNDEIVDHSRAKTDQVVDTFRMNEREREAKRRQLKEKRLVIKTKMEKRHEEHEDIVRRIDNADTGSELLDLAERLRRRNRQRSHRRQS